MRRDVRILLVGDGEQFVEETKTAWDADSLLY